MKKFEITKEQVLKVSEWGNSKDKELIKSWFPDAFKKELEAGKWAKSKNTNCLVFITEFAKYGFNGYGFDNENKFCDLKNDDWTSNLSLWRLATEQEVKTALINEAKKRGLIDGNYIKSTNGYLGLVNDGNWIYSQNANCLYYAGFILFNNGKWAEIIETITKEEAEKLLNKKII